MKVGMMPTGSLVHLAKRIEVDLTPWDEDCWRKRLEAAFDWAGQATPPGCWQWCLRHAPDLRDELDRSFDSIDTAFEMRDAGPLLDALSQFKEVVCTAIAQYQHELTPEPSEM